MDAELNNDLGYFVGAFEELSFIVAEQMKDQPMAQVDCLFVLLTKQLHDIERRVYALNCVRGSEPAASAEARSTAPAAAGSETVQ